MNHTKGRTIWTVWAGIGLLVMLVLASCQPVRPVSELPTSDSTPTQDSESPTITDQSEAEVYYNQGVGLLESGDFDQAIAYFDKAIALNPNHAEAYNNRGLASVRWGVQPGRASGDWSVLDFDKAIELDPDYAEAYLNRGNFYWTFGYYSGPLVYIEQAIQDFETYLELAPNAPDQKQVEDSIEQARQDFEQTRQSYEQIITGSDPDVEPDQSNVRAYLLRGLAQHGLGELDQAIADLDQAIELAPACEECYRIRAEAYLSKWAWSHGMLPMWPVILANIDSVLITESDNIENVIEDLEAYFELVPDAPEREQIEGFIEHVKSRR